MIIKKLPFCAECGVSSQTDITYTKLRRLEEYIIVYFSKCKLCNTFIGRVVHEDWGRFPKRDVLENSIVHTNYFGEGLPPTPKQIIKKKLWS